MGITICLLDDFLPFLSTRTQKFQFQYQDSVSVARSDSQPLNQRTMDIAKLSLKSSSYQISNQISNTIASLGLFHLQGWITLSHTKKFEPATQPRHPAKTSRARAEKPCSVPSCPSVNSKSGTDRKCPLMQHGTEDGEQTHLL
jgi:hypothetical protein